MPRPHRFILFLLATLLPAAALAAPPTYQLTPITVPPEYGLGGAASDLNDAGQISLTVGIPAHGSTSVRRNPDGTITSCGPLYAEASKILADGRILSDYTLPGGHLAWTVGDNTGYLFLTSPPNTPTSDRISAGCSDASNTVYGSIGGSLASWCGPDLTPTILGMCQGEATGAQGASRNGKYLVGSFGTNGGDPNNPGIGMPFIYSDGAFTPIHIPGVRFAQATGVNNNGTVIGFSLDFDHNARYAWVWNAGQLIFLTHPDGLSSGAEFLSPFSINDNGLIVGTDGLYAILWDADLTPSRLNDLAGVDIFTTNLTYPYAINNSNQIVAEGASLDYPGQSVPFLLTPIQIPDPTPTTLLGFAPLLSLLRPKRRTPAPVALTTRN